MHLGIDLGTSNSAIVGHFSNGLRLFKTADNKDVLPSAVFVDQRGHRFVGSRAYEQAAISPENVAREFKRLMGTSTPISLARAGLTLTPEEASAEIIRTLLSQARADVGNEPVEGTIITVPAAFNQMQTEATIAAGDLAGISTIGLIQEPIAAAMASMVGSSVRSGHFLVYDLGGGTFDVALVQSSGGNVNIIAHEGVNMLGGKDFDEALMREVLSPWLESNFDLPKDYRMMPDFQKLLKRLKLQVEKAKVELSSLDTTTIFMADDDVRVKDQSGKELFVDVAFSRDELERLISPQIERTITLCRNVIEKNGFSHGDIDRVVLIGGPSKMPLVRRRLPEDLGIPADLSTDPMTAVATGAAIYAESREWTGGQTQRKSSRASLTIGDDLHVKYDFPSRVAEDKANLRVTPDSNPEGWRVRIDAMDGWSSGDIVLTEKLRIELPLTTVGTNVFRATLLGNGKAPQTSELQITRTFASSTSVPATLTICVALEQVQSGVISEILEPLVKKGTPLPFSGTGKFKAARSLVGGQEGQIDIKLFQAPDGVIEPGLALLIGSFALDAEKHLQTGEVLRQGEDILVEWTMDDNGLLSGKISLPQHSVTFDMGTFYSPKIGQKDFAGRDGADLAQGLVADAEQSLQEVDGLLDQTAWQDVQKLKRRIELQTEALKTSDDPDTRRQAAEESLSVRQEISRLKSAPENQGIIIGKELVEKEELLEIVAPDMTDDAAHLRLQQLFSNARRMLDQKQWADAQICLSQISSILYSELRSRPEFNVIYFERLTKERYLAIDTALHERLIEAGIACIRNEDWDGLRRTNSSMIANQIRSPSSEPLSAQLGGLVRA